MRHFINLFQEREKKMENKIEQSKEKVAFITLRVSVCISKYDMPKPMWL